jgi:hypothetical protein
MPPPVLQNVTLFENSFFTKVKKVQMKLVQYDYYLKSGTLGTEMGTHRGKLKWRHIGRNHVKLGSGIRMMLP